MSTPPPSPGGETVAASVDFSEPLEPLVDEWVALSSDTDVDALDTAQRSTLRAKGGYFLREWLSEQTTLLLGATPSAPPPIQRIISIQSVRGLAGPKNIIGAYRLYAVKENMFFYRTANRSMHIFFA